MIENETKLDCSDALAFGLNRTGNWRNKMAVKHPSDQRNRRAAECLQKIAMEANQLTDEDFLRLRPHAGWANERWHESISDAARVVGFNKMVTDLPSFVTHLIRVLSQPVVAA